MVQDRNYNQNEGASVPGLGSLPGDRPGGGGVPGCRSLFMTDHLC